MSLKYLPWLLLLVGSAPALAQGQAKPKEEEAEAEVEVEATAEDEAPVQGSTRFFFDEPEVEESLQETSYDGSVTSTTMYSTESGGTVMMGAAAVEGASPVSRLFTDLRLQMDADHIGGGRWDFHGDLRGRYVAGSCRDIRVDSLDRNPCTRFQSGAFSGNELDARELYVRRGGDTVDVTFGRQYVLDLAATKIDGVRYERGSGDWKLIAFGGGAPSRISRDIRDDYPEVPPIAGGTGSKRALQVAGGGGAAYRFEQMYGALGGVIIFPLTTQQDGKREDPRTFLTANGYWRVVNNLDLYHFVVFDVTGAGGVGLTNLNVGVNFRPSAFLRGYVQATRVDTETLTTTAQGRIDDPGPAIGGQIQNNIEVQRIAAESLRGGVSTSFAQNRFELSTTLTMRRRPDIQLTDRAGAAAMTIAAAEATDITIQAVDRRSFLGLRLGGMVSRTFGGTPFGILGGDRSADRSESLIFQLDASRSFSDGRFELETYANLIQSNDETRADLCDPVSIETCYGSSAVQTIGLGGLMFFRFADDWFLLAGVNGARQSLTATDGAGGVVGQPGIIMLSGFGRLAYKF